MSKLKLAILDLYNGIPNQGMRCIKEIVEQLADVIDYKVFDVRQTSRVPDMTYDIFISSGGPGNPIGGDGLEGWEDAWTGWLDKVYQYNLSNGRKKHVLFICHSFQMAVAHFELANVCARKGISFGTFPVYREHDENMDLLFAGLDNPFWVADFRRFQVIEPNDVRLEEIGASVIALEKIRPHVDLERAVMAIRWSDEIVGVQFHPEADPEGMMAHFSRKDIKDEVIKDHGRDKWLQIMEDLNHPERITRTHETVIPGFLKRAVQALTISEVQSI
ncbi:type 1 glutamine amidotransferase [Lewinella sp. 4G2]|uniref:type 1 glutamine amidotransferase n=1 Tax=Lewinella sp. 4G2 TaxID=1803372 RepID=UPI0007B47DB4|nr:GMP synthase [Lewinella sp. 4G2]OAV44760.1 GMP synthase [Lewinella sp. 4G2]